MVPIQFQNIKVYIYNEIRGGQQKMQIISIYYRVQLKKILLWEPRSPAKIRIPLYKEVKGQ